MERFVKYILPAAGIVVYILLYTATDVLDILAGLFFIELILSILIFLLKPRPKTHYDGKMIFYLDNPEERVAQVSLFQDAEDLKDKRAVTLMVVNVKPN